LSYAWRANQVAHTSMPFRDTTKFCLFANGLNLVGILSQVFRPMMTAFCVTAAPPWAEACAPTVTILRQSVICHTVEQ
jgi:hypothetical protein